MTKPVSIAFPVPAAVACSAPQAVNCATATRVATRIDHRATVERRRLATTAKEHMRRNLFAAQIVSAVPRHRAEQPCARARNYSARVVTRSSSVIFCQIFPDNPVVSVSISFTVLRTIGSLND